MSPYIVTTIDPKGATDQDADGRSFYVPTSSCRAVATLEEARGAVIQAIPEECPGLIPAKAIAVATQIAHLVESGGTVGPLPDGTVIEVEPATYYDLWNRVPWGHRGGPYFELDGVEIIAAFNAREVSA